MKYQYFQSILVFVAFAMGHVSIFGAGTASNSVAVKMDKFVVSAARYHWTYAKTGHFEVLSSLKDTDFVLQVIEQAERIITVFEKNCPLFRLDRALPVKLILTDDEGVARFFTGSGNDIDQTAIDTPKKRPLNREGLPYTAEPVSVAGDEQACIAQLITKTYMNESRLPYAQKVRENAEELIAAYLSCCLKAKQVDERNIYVQPFGRPPLLSYLLIGRRTKDDNNRASWLVSDKRHTALVRRDTSIESRIIEERIGRDDIERLANPPGRMGAMNTIADDIMKAPYLELKVILERDEPPRWPPSGSSPKAYAYYFTYCREMTDFAYYCVVGPNPRAGLGFAKLVQDSGKRLLDEDAFKEYFGVGYDRFYAEMYKFFGGGAERWGLPEVTVWKFDAKNPPAKMVLRDANRNESARIISDWFALNNKDTTALNTLLLAREDAPYVMKDMDFIAALGLVEAKPVLSDKTDALKLLEQAAEANVARPRVYNELSRLRLENIKAGKEWGYKLNEDEVKAVMEPLFTTLKMPHLSPETYLQILDVMRNIDAEPQREFLEALAAGCRQFPDNIELLGEVVPVLLKQGMQSTAASLVDNASKSILTDGESDRLERLRGIVAGAGKQ